MEEKRVEKWALGVTRKDNIKNEYVGGTTKIANLGDKLQNARLCWYGHVNKREDYVAKKDDKDGGARQKENRKAKKVDGYVEKRHGKGWCC